MGLLLRRRAPSIVAPHTTVPLVPGAPDLTSRACDLRKHRPENSGDAQRRGTFVVTARRLEAPCSTRIRTQNRPPRPRSVPLARRGGEPVGHVARRVNAGGSVVY